MCYSVVGSRFDFANNHKDLNLARPSDWVDLNISRKIKIFTCYIITDASKIEFDSERRPAKITN